MSSSQVDSTGNESGTPLIKEFKADEKNQVEPLEIKIDEENKQNAQQNN